MRRFGLIGGIVLAGALLVGSAAGGSVRSGTTMPQSGYIGSIACAAPGDCAAGGWYLHPGGHRHEAFVVGETNDSWGKPIEVPGMAGLKGGGDSSVLSISCAAPGDCAAGGGYGDYLGGYRPFGDREAFLVSETNGYWGTAIEVPGIAKLNSAGRAYVQSISCAAPGECTAAGIYEINGGVYGNLSFDRAFLVTETNGVWGHATKVPGAAALMPATVGSVGVDSISCAAVGECVAGGYYASGAGAGSAFVVSETNGTWGKAIEVPGVAKLIPEYGDAWVTSISCGAVGQCAAGGTYSQDSVHYHAFVVSETNGSWGNAIEVRGAAILNSGDAAVVSSVSCAAAGECAAGGYSARYYTTAPSSRAFLVNETGGVWGNAIEVPGTATRKSGGAAEVNSVSCAAAGECAAGGFYTGSSNLRSAFVVTEKNGSWRNATKVPGTGSKMFWTGDGFFASGVTSISCTAVGECVAGASAWTGGFTHNAFVVGETNGDWGPPVRVRNFPASCVVPYVVKDAISNAKRRLKSFDCAPGTITTVYSTVRAGQVMAQRPNRGTELSARARVALTVSNGTKK